MIFAASYCRGSTDKDDQANSFESQQQYFKEYIDRQPDWELYRVYGDEGITAREREQLSYETATLKTDVKSHIGDLLGREADETFQKSILDTMIVYPDRRLEVRLNLLPTKWRFVLDSIADIRRRSGCHLDPSVPMSVSRPFSSSKGML